MAEVTVTKDNFKAEVLESDIPVLVDFWASWCGPCKMLAPILEEVGREKEGSLKIAKINVDDEPELANQFGINSIPSVFLFKNGQVANRAVGLMPKAKVLEFIS
ncbi:MAG: thioredoxin [Oscillospiraceae bacterium]|nr:thioredoxin [Oscillospiraceae bacterium]